MIITTNTVLNILVDGNISQYKLTSNDVNILTNIIRDIASYTRLRALYRKVFNIKPAYSMCICNHRDIQNEIKGEVYKQAILHNSPITITTHKSI